MSNKINTYSYEYQQLINTYNTNIKKINKLNISIKNKKILFQKLYIGLQKQIQNLKLKYQQISAQQQQTQQQQQQTQPMNKCLAIGINYIGSEYELFGCINDANNIINMLKNNFNYTQNILITDNTNIKPTKQNIIDQFTNLLKYSKSGDNLFFVFSGHGSQIIDSNGDENDGLDEVIVSKDLKYISDDQFRNIIHDNLKQNVRLFCIFDSCHSGTCFDLRYNENGTINNSIIDTISQVFFISGCKDEQTSEDAYLNGKNTGALTFGFLEIIKKYNYLKSDITYKQFMDDLRQILIDNNFSQTPQLSYGQPINVEEELFKL
jgi:hypothetical protein